MIPGQRDSGVDGIEARPAHRKPDYKYVIQLTYGSPGEAETAGPVEALFSDVDRALFEAKERSRAENVRAAAVTGLAVDEPGLRKRIALFEDGKQQELPHFSNPPARKHRMG